MKFLLTTFLTLPHSIINHTDNIIPITAQLVVKYQVLDDKMSPQHANCAIAGTVKEFSKSESYACSFKLHGLEFDVEYKYLVDRKGYLKEFQPYLSEGADVFSIEELRKDPSYMKSKNLEQFHISFTSTKDNILDGNDTIIIERIFPTEKLILARKNSHTPKGRRFIYQYQ